MDISIFQTKEYNMHSIKVIGEKDIIGIIGNSVDQYNNELETHENSKIITEYNDDHTMITFKAKNKKMLTEFVKNMSDLGSGSKALTKIDNNMYVI